MKKPGMGNTPNTSIGGMNTNPISKGPGMNNMQPPNGMNGMKPPNGMNNMNGPGKMGPPNGMNGMSDPGMGGPPGYGEVAKNRQEYNSDPKKGGFQWRKQPMNPMLAFSAAVNRTPDHRMGVYVLPWDNRQCDYVYAAADKNVFKGALTMKKFRQVNFNNFFKLQSYF